MLPPRHPDGTRPSTLSLAKTLGAVSAIGALVARRWQLVHVIVGDETLDEVQLGLRGATWLDCGKNSSDTEKTPNNRDSLRHTVTCAVCRKL